MIKKAEEKKTGAFSLVEVVVATIIFLIAAMGIFNIFSAIQNLSTDSGDEIIAANYGRQLLEGLRANVDQNTWNSWYLNCDSAWHSWPAPATSSDAFFNLSPNNAADYICEPLANGLRKVTLNLTW